jgi:predicted acylesterase/phospholipase RssA
MLPQREFFWKMFSETPVTPEEKKLEYKSQEAQKIEIEVPVEVPIENGPNQQHIHIGVSNRLPHEFALSLSGCGFLGSYHFGVMICFFKNAKKLMRQVTRISGASVGSLVAVLSVLCPEKLEESLALLYECADELNTMTFGAMTPGFYINERIANIARKFVPDDISPAQNKLYISLTRHRDKMNRIVSTYPDKEYLIKCLLASCFIPIYSMGYYGVPPELDGEQYIDGGYTENLPNFKDIYTVTISPFSGSAMISPHDDSVFEWKMKLGNQQLKVKIFKKKLL